jgi:hypothetical protein
MIPVVIRLSTENPHEAEEIRRGLQSLSDHASVSDMVTVARTINEDPGRIARLIRKYKSNSRLINQLFKF